MVVSAENRNRETGMARASYNAVHRLLEGAWDPVKRVRFADDWDSLGLDIWSRGLRGAVDCRVSYARLRPQSFKTWKSCGDWRRGCCVCGVVDDLEIGESVVSATTQSGCCFGSRRGDSVMSKTSSRPISRAEGGTRDD